MRVRLERRGCRPGGLGIRDPVTDQDSINAHAGHCRAKGSSASMDFLGESGVVTFSIPDWSGR